MYFLLYAHFYKTPAEGYTGYMSHRRKKAVKTKAYRFDLTCEGKRFFKSEKEALEAADFRMLENMSVTIGIYQCATCRYWHLTSIKPKP
jgi:hypothetical protein